MQRSDADVLILGGGLSGLTLALQLRARHADLSIRVIERRAHPLPAAAHKVGESTVEIGAHYFADTLGLRAHLDAAQIRKFGFRFFFSDRSDNLGNATELGVRKVLPTPTWQIDRGLFETFLGEETRRRGIEFIDDAVVRQVDICGADNTAHAVRIEHGGEMITVHARWLIDASGRAALLRRKLDLDQANGHVGNAVWFRIDDRIEIDRWCADSDWTSRCTPAERWRSTNHLVGPGYWVWMIPLSSGAHSIGIVADPALHALESMNSLDKALDWLSIHQPELARECAARRDRVMDFAFLRNYSHGCRQVFSADRWAITGDAGVFLDPFYSPGSDFIAIANTYITELIGHDLAGERLAPYARFYEQTFLSFYESTLTLFRDQYALFGNATVLPIKVIWDYTYYWGTLCQLVFQNRLTDIAMLGELRAALEQARDLNIRMQGFFRDWHAADPGLSERCMLDQCTLPWFTELNLGLHDTLDSAQLRARIHANVDLLEQLATSIAARAKTASNCIFDRDSSSMSGDASTRPELFAAA